MSRNLILYYSRRGENYVNGAIKVIAKGNTEIVAEYIQRAVGGDLFQIETVDPYPSSYHACTDVAKRELREGARPKLRKYLDSIAEYDNIFVCGPAGGAPIRWRYFRSWRSSTSPASASTR